MKENEQTNKKTVSFERRGNKLEMGSSIEAGNLYQTCFFSLPLFAWLENDGLRASFCSLDSLSQCHTGKYFVMINASEGRPAEWAVGTNTT